jgi:phage baseplate assembly protein W
MPITQIVRVDPLDLQKNIAIGVSLPFNGPGVFNSTFSTKDQIKSNMINLLLTNKGERVMNPNFGADIKNRLFEGMTDSNASIIKDQITTTVNTYVPQVTINNISINYDQDHYTADVVVSYTLNISGTADQINIQFQ